MLSSQWFEVKSSVKLDGRPGWEIARDSQDHDANDPLSNLAIEDLVRYIGKDVSSGTDIRLNRMLGRSCFWPRELGWQTNPHGPGELGEVKRD
jgi:hypothetical protein